MGLYSKDFLHYIKASSNMQAIEIKGLGHMNATRSVCIEKLWLEPIISLSPLVCASVSPKCSSRVYSAPMRRNQPVERLEQAFALSLSLSLSLFVIFLILIQWTTTVTSAHTQSFPLPSAPWHRIGQLYKAALQFVMTSIRVFRVALLSSPLTCE